MLPEDKMETININCDLGEGTFNENEIMPYIQSCNIACGGHAGDLQSMKEVVGLALKYKVLIGAHPSYPDKENFGRKSVDLSAKDLKESISLQLGNFDNVLQKCNGKLHHIKPHGALYNDIARDKRLATTFLEAVNMYKKRALLYVPYNSIIADVAQENGFQILYEAFADRSYNEDLSLVKRTLPDAVLHDKNAILKQVQDIANHQKVVTVNGKSVFIKATTFCVHSDTENAVQIVKYLYNSLYTTAIG